MNRRSFLRVLGLGPAAFAAAQLPAFNTTPAVAEPVSDAMPQKAIEDADAAHIARIRRLYDEAAARRELTGAVPVTTHVDGAQFSGVVRPSGVSSRVVLHEGEWIFNDRQLQRLIARAAAKGRAS